MNQNFFFVDLAGNEHDWITKNDNEKTHINKSNNDLKTMLRNGIKHDVTTAAYPLGRLWMKMGKLWMKILVLSSI